MKKASLIATALVIGSGGSQVHAQALKGSDTLERVTSEILGGCAGVAPLTYAGTGSTNGENAMALNLNTPSDTNFQQVAPMSRPIRCTRLAPGGDLASVNGTAQGYFLGMDGLSIFRSECTFVSGACQAYSNAEAAGLPDGYVWSDGLDAPLPPPAVAGRYGIVADKLRVLYFGRHHDNTTNCNSTVRQALVNTWDELFEGAQSETCTQLRHAFRRDDASGTTDVFRTLLGIPSAVTFCNGTSTQDNDPIRRPCGSAASPTLGGNYDVCQTSGANAGTLGVVLPIAVPATNPYSLGAVPTPGANCTGSTAANCGTVAGRCQSGVFGYRPWPGFAACPDGTARLAGQCRAPLNGTSPRCSNTLTNRPSGAPSTMDARIYNQVVRNDDGSILTSPFPFYRIHETRTFHGCGCKEADATRQIACLAGANGCSEGFAGREGDQALNSRVVQLAKAGSLGTDAAATACVLPSDDNVRSFTYPFSRKLYFNIAKGVGGINPATANGAQQEALRTCFANRATVDTAITNANFVTLGSLAPAGVVPVETFSNTTTCQP